MTAAQAGQRYRTTALHFPQTSSSGPAGAPHRGHATTSGFAQALQTFQPGWTGAKQFGHTIWSGWAREQNGHAAEFSSIRFPQKRQGRLYPGIVPGWRGSYFPSVPETTRPAGLHARTSASRSGRQGPTSPVRRSRSSSGTARFPRPLRRPGPDDASTTTYARRPPTRSRSTSRSPERRSSRSRSSSSS